MKVTLIIREDGRYVLSRALQNLLDLILSALVVVRLIGLMVCVIAGE